MPFTDPKLLNHPSNETLYFLTETFNKLPFFFFLLYEQNDNHLLHKMDMLRGNCHRCYLAKKNYFQAFYSNPHSKRAFAHLQTFPLRCCLLKPMGWLSFVSIFQLFSTLLDHQRTALNTSLCMYRTPLMRTAKIPY